jgi:glycosyltransferase involved in cell wall biosynthesis
MFMNGKTYLEVLEEVLPYPNSCLDSSWLHRYLDALVFGNFSTAYEASLKLDFPAEEHWKFALYPPKQQPETSSPFLKEWLSLLYCEKTKTLDSWNFNTSSLSSWEYQFLKEQFFFAYAIEKKRKEFSFQSWRPPIHYLFKIKEKQLPVSSSHIMVHMAPVRYEWAALFDSLKGKSIVLIFDDEESLWQCAPLIPFGVPYFVLTRYWIPQHSSQNISQGEYEILQFPFQVQAKLTSLLTSLINKKWKSSLEEHPEANQLYSYAQEKMHERNFARRGESCLFSSLLKQDADLWWQEYPIVKSKSLLDKSLEERVVAIRKRRRFKKRDTLHVTHVVHRLIDEGYAPTARLRKLIEAYPSDIYTLSVLVLDVGTFRHQEYPFYFDDNEENSFERGKKTLQQMKSLGIRVWVDNRETCFEDLCVWACSKLEETDIAVFHDSSAVSLAIAAKTNVPKTVAFIHGVLPKFPVFDDIILPFQKEKELFEASYGSKVHIHVNPLGYSFFTSNKGVPLPDDHRYLATVSNMLDIRLNWSFCEAVAHLLRRFPDTLYVLIGDVINPCNILDKFRKLGVVEQVVIAGRVEKPFQFLKNMHLYLNEFPIGSGLASLEAMAAGVPVLALYDCTASFKSREAANYFGVEMSPHSVEEWINKGIELLETPSLYSFWKQYVSKRYSLFSDEISYYQRHQEIISKMKEELIFESLSFDLKEYWHVAEAKDSVIQELQLELGRLPQKSKRKNRSYRVAHCLGRLCDHYAVTKRVEEIIQHYKGYEPLLLTTEYDATMETNYSSKFMREDSSIVRAPFTLHRLKSIPVYLGDSSLGLKSVLERTLKILKENQVDTVIFHDFSVLHCLIAKLCDVPLTILMEHGEVPKLSGIFDAAIVSHPNELKFLKDCSFTCFSNPNVLNIEKYWAKREKPSFTLGKDEIILATASHSLPVRMNSQMKKAVLDILERCPQAYYVLIGPCSHTIFPPTDRIIPIGRVENVAEVLRGVDIYLNEFPVGGGLVLLEAMAASCPIVSFYDPDGGIRGRHGGNYFGLDRVVHSKEEYVDLACSLIQDKEKYQEWSAHARREYLARSDIVEYMRQHQEVIEECHKSLFSII